MNNPALNKIIHEPARLKIMVLLASSHTESIPFTQIKQTLDFTAGNLSIQLKTLEKAGYIGITKQFADNKPKTDISITKKGKAELIAYMTGLEDLLSKIRM